MAGAWAEDEEVEEESNAVTLTPTVSRAAEGCFVSRFCISVAP